MRDSLNIRRRSILILLIVTLSLTGRESMCLLIPHSEGQSEYQEKGYTPAPYIHTFPSQGGIFCVYSSLTVMDSLNIRRRGILLLLIFILSLTGRRVCVYSSLTVRDSLNIRRRGIPLLLIFALSLTGRESLCLLIPHSGGQSEY